MQTPYIPNKLGAYKAWSDNFYARINADPTDYGLTAGDAAALLAVKTPFDAAYALSETPASRTKANVASRDCARVDYEKVQRPLAMIARAFLLADGSNEAIALMEELGLHVPDPTPTPHPPCPTQPCLAITGTLGGCAIITATDSAAESSRARPPGTIGYELWGTAGVSAAIDPSQMQYLGLKTTFTTELSYGPEWQGKVGSFAGRWINSRGQPGAFGPITAAYLS